jgi:NADH:ubiquinone oxidoreductase subunit 6 (subunit J)
MNSLGLTLFGVGFVGLLITVIYSFIDKERTGELFRRKRIFVPLMAASGVLGFAGMLLVYLSQSS